MNKSYDVYMCRPDNRPILTIDKLRQFQCTIKGGWHEYVDPHTGVRRARDAGYKIPFDIFQSYLADEQKRISSTGKTNALGGGAPTIGASRKKTGAWFSAFVLTGFISIILIALFG